MIFKKLFSIRYLASFILNEYKARVIIILSMYQVKWFNKRKGYGFVSGDLFVHHSDITVTGYKYLKRGEYIMGEVMEIGGKKKLSNIRAPMEGGKLMCEVEREEEAKA